MNSAPFGHLFATVRGSAEASRRALRRVHADAMAARRGAHAVMREDALNAGREEAKREAEFAELEAGAALSRERALELSRVDLLPAFDRRRLRPRGGSDRGRRSKRRRTGAAPTWGNLRVGAEFKEQVDASAAVDAAHRLVGLANLPTFWRTKGGIFHLRESDKIPWHAEFGRGGHRSGKLKINMGAKAVESRVRSTLRGDIITVKRGMRGSGRLVGNVRVVVSFKTEYYDEGTERFRTRVFSADYGVIPQSQILNGGPQMDAGMHRMFRKLAFLLQRYAEESSTIIGIGTSLTSLNWVGACLQEVDTDGKFQGVKVKFIKNKKPGLCGARCVTWAVKNVKGNTSGASGSIKTSMMKEQASAIVFNRYFKRINFLEKELAQIELELKVDMRADVGLDIYVLDEVLRRCNVGLELYDASRLGCGLDPDFSGERAGDILHGTVTLVLYEGHYGVVLCPDAKARRCKRCQEVVKGVRHRCKWTCEFCGVDSHGVKAMHKCPEKRAALFQEEEKKVGDADTPDMEKALIAEVQAIMAGEFTERDDAVTAAWIEACGNDGDGGRFSGNTALLGEAGTGKTTAAVKMIRHLLGRLDTAEDEVKHISDVDDPFPPPPPPPSPPPPSPPPPSAPSPMGEPMLLDSDDDSDSDFDIGDVVMGAPPPPVLLDSDDDSDSDFVSALPSRPLPPRPLPALIASDDEDSDSDSDSDSDFVSQGSSHFPKSLAASASQTQSARGLNLPLPALPPPPTSAEVSGPPMLPAMRAPVLPEEIIVLAAQGVAVTQYPSDKLEGVVCTTIHNFLGWEVGKSLAQLRLDLMSERKRAKVSLIKNLKHLVLDEPSPIPLTSFNMMDQIFRDVRGFPGVPFGGVRVHVVGDFGQTASFEAGQKEFKPLFMTDVWAALDFEVFSLKQQRRIAHMDEGNRAFQRARLLVYRGVANAEVLGILNRRLLSDVAEAEGKHMLKVGGPGLRHLMFGNVAVNDMNAKLAALEEGQVFSFEPTWKLDKEGTPICKNIPDSFDDLTSNERRLIDFPLSVRVGSVVMFTSNKYLREASAANGTEGVVASVEGKTINILLESGKVVAMHPSRVYGVRGPCKFYPLKLGKARSAFKVQSLTMDAVCVWPSDRDSLADSSFATGVMSMCTTRVRDWKDFYVGTPLKAEHIRWSPICVNYMKLCAESSRDCEVQAMLSKLKYTGRRHVAVGGDLLGSRVLRTKSKSAFKGEMPFLTRWQIRQARTLKLPLSNHFKLFNKLLCYDFETSKMKSASGAVVDTPYGVFAKYWTDYRAEEFAYGVKEAGGVETDTLDRFREWLIAKCMDDVAKWQAAAGSGEKLNTYAAPIKVVAFNGAAFDHGILLSSFIKRGLPENVSFEINAMKGGARIVSAGLVFTDPTTGKRKKMLTFWDPSLWLPLTLDDAHTNFKIKSGEGEEKSDIAKGVFPHDYIARVGANVALDGKEHQMCISKDFPFQQLEKVKGMVASGDLKCAKDEDGKDIPDSVMFNCFEQYNRYVKNDVLCLEDVVEGMQKLVWEMLPKDHNLPITSIATASSFALYVQLLLCENKFRPKKSAESFKQKSVDDILEGKKGKGKRYRKTFTGRDVFEMAVERPSLAMSSWIRDGNFGGCCYARRLHYRYHDLEAIEKEPVSPARYQKVDDSAPMYFDANGLYHAAQLHYEYPYGSSTTLTIDRHIEDIAEFTAQWKKLCVEGKTTANFPMFYAQCDVYPNKHDVEPFLPSRKANGGVEWTCEDKLNKVYNSVDLERVLRSGARVDNFRKVVLWGHLTKSKKWSGKGHRGKLFEKVAKLCRDLRDRAKAENLPGLKVFGKLIINSLYGKMSLRDKQTTYKVFYSESPDSPAHQEMIALAKDPKMKVVASHVHHVGDWESSDPDELDPRPVFLMRKYERDLEEGEGYAAMAPQIGGFVLAYSRLIMSDAIDLMLGEKRYCKESLYKAGIYYMDTDSFIVSASLAKKLEIHWVTLGLFSDDLHKMWRTKEDKKIAKANLQCSRYNEDGTPLGAKFLEGAFPAKKVYGGRVILPNGEIKEMKTKIKGLRREGIALMAGETFDGMLAEIDQEVKGLKRAYQRKAAAKVKKDERLRAKSHTGTVTYKNLLDGNFVGAMQTRKRHGIVINKTSNDRGCAPFDSERSMITRRLLPHGAQFSDERVPYDDEHPDCGKPRGWVGCKPGCLCDSPK